MGSAAAAAAGSEPIQMNVIGALPSSQGVLAHPMGWDTDHDDRREFIIRLKLDVNVVRFLYYESSQNDTFEQVHSTTFQGPPGLPVSFRPSDVGDADGDGRAEVTVIGQIWNERDVRLLESPAPDTHPRNTVWLLPTSSYQREVKIADTDGDGANELVIAGHVLGQPLANENRIEIYENLGDNAYGQILYYDNFPMLTGTGFQSMAITDDLDGDGRPEIVVAGLGSGGPGGRSAARVVALESTGSGGYTQSWELDLPYTDGELVNATTLADGGDLDGDGKKEFVVGGPSTVSGPGDLFFSVLYVVEAQSDNAVAVVASLVHLTSCPCLSTAAAVADIDGDGRRDIVHGAGGGGFSVWRNTGDNAWQQIGGWTDAQSDFTSIGVGDHDRDGKAEVIVPQPFATSPSTLIFEIDPADAADLDGDGVVDAIDNCPVVTNPKQEDRDSDASGDACDCAPADSTLAAAPTEIGGLHVDPAGVMSIEVRWDSQDGTAGSATVYDVARGSLSALRSSGYAGGAAVCAGSGLGDSPYAEGRDDCTAAASDGCWYLARARNACATGTYGTGSAGSSLDLFNPCP